MFNSEMSPADYAAISGSNGWGDGSFLWWIIIIICLFGGFGNNWNNGGVADQYTLASDFATLQRQIDSTSTNTNNLVMSNADQLQRQVTQVANGISSLGYDQLAQMNNINMGIANSTYDIRNAIQADTVANMQNTNTLSSQLANCCCNTRYENLQNANATQNMIGTGFAETNYNNATNTCALKTQIGETGTALSTQMASSTRDITDSTNAGIQAILAKLNEQEMNAKQAQIDALTQQVNALTLSASQQAQNAYLVSKLGATAPIAAYTVPNPNAVYTYGCGCNCQ